MVVQRLKTIAHVIAGQSPSSDDVKPLEEGIPFIQGNAEFGILNPIPKWECSTATKFAEPGDILVSVRAPVGEVNIADTKIGIGRGLAAIRPKDASLSKWLYFALLSNKEYLNSIATGSTFTSVTPNEIGNIRLTIPECPEAIADELDRELAEIDELIDNFESFHKVLRERYESELEELLNNELSNIPHQKLSWHVEFMNGDRGVSYPSRDEFVQSGVPFVNAGHLREGTVDFSEMNYISEAKYQSMGGAKLRNEDVLYCLRGSVGKCGIYPQNHGALASSLVALRTKDQLLPKFLLLLLSSRNIQFHIDTLLTGSAQPNLSVEQLASIRIPVPGISQQISILKSYKEKKSSFESLTKTVDVLGLLSERKETLINSLLSGERDG